MVADQDKAIDDLFAPMEGYTTITRSNSFWLAVVLTIRQAASGAPPELRISVAAHAAVILDELERTPEFRERMRTFEMELAGELR